MLYLELMKKCLLNSIYRDDNYDEYKRENGIGWPPLAHTMIGKKRLDNIQYCVEKIIKNNVEGDLIETGVWRGGATIFMRSILKAYDIKNRNVWVVDSFEGLPLPNEKDYPLDKGSTFHLKKELAISLEEVMNNFRRYDLLDDQVKFLKGWFKDTLPKAPINKLAVIRLDGDLYESTIQGLEYLYPKLSIGGYLIVDDYGIINSCKCAVDDYRTKHNIKDEIIKIDRTGIFWHKTM